MAFDLVIRNGSVVFPDEVRIADVAIAGGQIAEVGQAIGGSGAEEIDAAALHVLPGVIDSHVHFNEPGRADWEGIATGSAACAAGGTTCFFDMPLNASPPTLDGESFDLKRAAVEKSSRVDFALWGGLTPGNLDQLASLADRGVIGFKAFMSSSGMDDFACADDASLRMGMKHAAALRLPVAVHAESEEMTAALAAAARSAGKRTARDYLDSRPIAAEVDAIQRACDLAGETGCMLHVVHVSSAAGVRQVLAARRRGVDVTCETCPHYLLFNEEDLLQTGAPLKCAPPLRPMAEVHQLWAALMKGDIDFLASDHSPCPASMKAGDDFFAVWGGVAGCQSLLAGATSQGMIGVELCMPHVAALTSGNVARRYRVGGKGSIVVGADADLVLLDSASRTLNRDDLRYRHAISPYVGRSFRYVRRTIVRGHTVFADNQSATRIKPKFVQPARN